MPSYRKTKKSAIIVTVVGVALSVILAVGTIIAMGYQSLLDVFFSKSGYVANIGEKELCKNVVEEGAVLLKNEDDVLPLNNDEKKVSLLGQDAVDFVYGGSGSGSVDTANAPTLKTAFEAAGYTVNDVLWDFYTNGAGKSYRKTTPDETGRGDFAVNEVPLSVYTDAVKNSLKDSDVGVCVIGRSGGESADLPKGNLASGYKYLKLDKNERDMIELACATYNKVILIVNANNPMELGFLEDEAFKNVKAVIWAGGVGQEGLYAIPNIISGSVNPSGRLVDTYAYDSTSAPSYQNLGNYTIANSTVDKGNKYIVYAEGIYVGYRYYETRYEDVVLGRDNSFDYAKEVLFPFGYGLSFTKFEWSNYKVKAVENNKFEVTVDVKNVGKRAGKDVVEIYAQKPYTEGGVEVASAELVGFAKTVLLEAGQKETVKITVDKKDLASYDYLNNKTYILNKGNYYISAGKNVHDALNNILNLKGKSPSDKMTDGGDGNLASLVMTVDSIDATTFSKSEYTGNTITNQFDDVDVNYYEALTYLTRSDWEGSFPTTFKNGSWTATERMLADLEWYNVNDDTTDDAAVNAFAFKTDSTDTSYTVKDLIGVSKTDKKWDDIVDQLSYTQMTKLIRMGGYSTPQIDRIALPATIDKDGPSGISGTLVGGDSCMAWPAEVVMASTWNRDMIQNLGVKFGEDSIASGVAGVYGPGADIHRSPYSGRNFEYYSEDPFLSAEIAASEMKGLRSKGVIAYIKHYALNDQETNRYGGAVFANEQAMREIFLKGFEGAVAEGKATAMMAAMNRIGTRWVGAHKGAMTEVLRNEWGFEGFVITDQASVPGMFYQDHISGLWAGCDMWLNTNESFWSLKEQKNDKTMQYYIHRSAKNILYSITDSWAVNEAYKTNEEGTVIEQNITVFPWRVLLFAVDGIVWAATIVCSAVLWILTFKRKNSNITVEE